MLAGGKSSRIGVDKSLIRINGESMICRVVNSLSRAGLEPIRVSVARVSDIEAVYYTHLTLPTICSV